MISIHLKSSLNLLKLNVLSTFHIYENVDSTVDYKFLFPFYQKAEILYQFISFLITTKIYHNFGCITHSVSYWPVASLFCFPVDHWAYHLNFFLIFSYSTFLLYFLQQGPIIFCTEEYTLGCIDF